MPTRHVDLTDHFADFIEVGVHSGRFADVSAAVTEGLELLETRQKEDQAESEWLQTECKEAFASLDRGEGIVFQSADELCLYIDQMFEEVLAESPAGEVNLQLAGD